MSDNMTGVVVLQESLTEHIAQWRVSQQHQ
jgi:hypothetical protein